MRLYRLCTWVVVLVATVAAPRVANAAPITYSESVSGDLPVFWQLFNLDVGLNTISGTWTSLYPEGQAPVLDFDQFRFSVPVDTVLSSVTFSGTASSLTIFGHSSQFLLYDHFPLTAPFLASFTSAFTIASPVLNTSAFGTVLPLGPGTYALSQSLVASALVDYTWTFEVTPAAVSEPTSLLLLGSGIAGVAARVRRRRKLQAHWLAFKGCP